MYFKKLSLNLQLYVASKILGIHKDILRIRGFIITDQMESVARDYLQNNKPLSKIFHCKHFWKHEFYTNEHTLDPRPETEALVEKVLENNHTATTIVEFGVGTGAVLLSLMSEMPSCSGIGIDISREALNVCSLNAKNLGLHPSLYCMDLGNFFCDFPAILVSNPPYLTQEEIDSNQSILRYDPAIALYGGLHGLEVYEKIANVVRKCNFTHIYLEAPLNKAEKVANMFSFHSEVHIIS